MIPRFLVTLFFLPLLTHAEVCFVVGVSDGDTLTARCERLGNYEQVRVRLAEIDAPEKRQPYGERSRQSLAAMCFQRQAEVKTISTDRYGRTVARVVCDGRDASAEQVRAGLAWAYPRYVTDPSIPVLEQQARAARSGLWTDSAPTPPWEWRQRRRQGSK